MTDPAPTPLDGHDPHITVLIVDDEPAIRELVSVLLEDEGYTVRHACDGVEALREVDADGIDLVLSDVKMPRLDGVSLAHRLSTRDHTVPVVLMSAVPPRGKPPQVPFLRKPFALDHLIAVIAAALARNGHPLRVGDAQHHASHSPPPF